MDKDLELQFDEGELDISDCDIENSSDAENIVDEAPILAEPEVIVENTKKNKKMPKAKKEKAPKVKKEKVNKSKKVEEQIPEEPEVLPERALYILTDNKTDGMLPYMRNCGLNISAIIDNVDALKNLMLMQFNDMRIVIVDTGTGKFITPTIRKSIVDIIGMSDETTKFTVFYTDSLLKSDSSAELGKVAKTIDWIKYKSTAVCVATMLSYKETYIRSSETSQNVMTDPKEILEYKGVPVNADLEAMSPLTINPMSIHKQVVETSDEGIRRFKLRL